MISKRSYRLPHTNCENKIIVRNIRRVCSKINHPIPLKEMSWITWLEKTRDKDTSSVVMEVRRIRPKPKEWNSKRRSDSSVGAVPFKVISSILGWYTQTSFSGKWRIWDVILGFPTEIAVNQSSWPRHRQPSLTQICQQSSLTRALRVPIRM